MFHVEVAISAWGAAVSADVNDLYSTRLSMNAIANMSISIIFASWRAEPERQIRSSDEPVTTGSI